MTPGNCKRVEKVILRLNTALKNTKDAQDMTFVLHESIADIVVVLNDLNLRPEVNSEK